MVHAYRLTPLELAGGYVPGFLPISAQPAAGIAGRDQTARNAFVATVRDGLQRSPCFVAFSGGRDSSAVLAVADDVARREGLSRPIPVVMDYPSYPAAQETQWQELVLNHLGLQAVRLDGSATSDLLGENARETLQSLGPVWPVTAHDRTPLLELARGGSLLTGEGGDEVLGPQRITPLVGTWRRRPRPSRQVLSALAFAVAPRPVRRIIVRGQSEHNQWMRRPAARKFVQQVSADEADEPLRWAAAVLRQGRSRAGVLGLQTLDILSAQYDVHQLHPFLDQRFLSAFAAEGSPRGFVSRTEAMTHLFADVLPAAVLGRTSKATFNEAVMGLSAKAFAQDWDGTGVPLDLVDPVALRDEWLSETPSAASMPLLQHAWWSQNVRAA